MSTEETTPVVPAAQDDSPAPKEEKEDDVEEAEAEVDAQAHLDKGVRSLALKKYDEACDSLSRAVEALTEKYGELAPEMGDAVMLYGKALLYNAIAQSAVLGGGGPSAKVTDEAVHNATAGPSTSNGNGTSAANWKFSFGGDAEEEEEGDEEEEQEEEEGPGAGDREDDLESAFLMLDMARTIFGKVAGDEAKSKRAEVHRLLGDVATESEQFNDAVKEYTSSLDILTTMLPPYDRSLSELHMLIALALDFVPNAVNDAVSHAEKAKSVLELKLEQLEGIEKDKRSEKDEKEIVDIKELMGDVDMKIEDLKVVPQEAPKTESEKALEAMILGATGPGKTNAIVNNLNSLVKKKKPVPAATEEETSANGSGLKRKAEEEGEVNGNGTTSEATAAGAEKKVKFSE